jgi:hypothetical protein
VTIAIEVLSYGLAVWMGGYLIARNPAKVQLCLSGLGLLAYALALASDVLAQLAGPASRTNLQRLHWFLIFMPAILWTGALIRLLPEELRWRSALFRSWAYAVLPASLLLLFIAVSADLLTRISSTDPGLAYPLFAAALILPVLAALVLLVRNLPQATEKRALGILLTALLFFALGTGLLLVPMPWLPRFWVLLAIGFDLVFLGLSIALLDSLDEGETLLPDMLRSFDASFLAALVFGGQVLLVMLLATGVTFGMVALLLATLASAILWQTFSELIQSSIDQVAFAGFPTLRRSRARLRAAGNALPRLNTQLDVNQLEDEKFTRITRRALSNFNDLPRLATSPLTRMSLIDERLRARGAPGDTLERAAELKAVLSESITRLKPRGQDDFGASDEWRFFNALYYPYVVGLRPYSRRATYDGLDESTKEALRWFQTIVPERTLYNWQTAAAKLVAQDLREQNQALS